MIHPEHTDTGTRTGTASQAQAQISNAPGRQWPKPRNRTKNQETSVHTCTRTHIHPRHPHPHPHPSPHPHPHLSTLKKNSRKNPRNARSPERDDLARGLARLDVGREGRTVGQLRARERRVVVDVADLCMCVQYSIFSRAHWASVRASVSASVSASVRALGVSKGRPFVKSTLRKSQRATRTHIRKVQRRETALAKEGREERERERVRHALRTRAAVEGEPFLEIGDVGVRGAV